MTIDLTRPLQYDNCDNGTAFQIHDGKRQIAIVEIAALDDQPRYEDIPEGEAYARLFAASPHLGSALKELVRCVRGGDKTAGVSMDDALIDADEALAKAGVA